MTTDSTPRPDDTTAAKSPAELELDDSLRSIREVGESATGREGTTPQQGAEDDNPTE